MHTRKHLNVNIFICVPVLAQMHTCVNTGSWLPGCLHAGNWVPGTCHNAMICFVWAVLLRGLRVLAREPIETPVLSMTHGKVECPPMIPNKHIADSSVFEKLMPELLLPICLTALQRLASSACGRCPQLQGGL